MSWTKLYEAKLHHVVKPLCLIDGRVSLFQGRSHRKQCDLVMYDWSRKEMKRFNIRDYPGHLQVFPCVDPILKPIDGPDTTEETKMTKKTKAKAKAVPQACVHRNASSTQDEAKPLDTMDEGKTHHLIGRGECTFDRGSDGDSLEEIPAKRRRRHKEVEE
ncbi:uncharacterized protein LOC130994958 [Salvia miltiorrhiza]|uniref:uncharacterized protein LOC130994958 n=1 Tax=Salvia miltiorrhiza TaxID=226208 RepID=UPI0025AB6E39|nr:uncharacterized protein LOC130994958 [Salvia miltiorrhiza]